MRKLPKWTERRNVETWSKDIEKQWRRVDERMALYERILAREETR